MRAVVLAAVLVSANGCRKSPSTEPDAGVSLQIPESEGMPVVFAGEYDGENRAAADAKYKGKRVVCARVVVGHIDRAKDGRLYVAPLPLHLVGPSPHPGSGSPADHVPVRDPEPCYFYYLRSETDAREIHIGGVYEITGICRGQQKDNYWRAGIAHMNWHVDFDDCTVMPMKK